MRLLDGNPVWLIDRRTLEMAIPDATITRHQRHLTARLTKENSIFVHLSDLSAVEHVVADKDNFVKSEIIRAPAS